MPIGSWPELHGAIVHFPVALLLTALAYEVGAFLLRKPAWRVVSFWSLVGAVAMSAPALLTGWFTGAQMFGHLEHLPAPFVLHRAVAFSVSAVALILLLLRIRAHDEPKGGSLVLCLGLTLLAGAMVAYTGYQGGQMSLGGNAALMETEPTGGRPGPKLPAVDPATLAAGASLYRAQGCSGCHRLGKQGGSNGPDLTFEGRRRPNVDWQFHHLLLPDKVVPNSTMPAYSQLKPEELQALASYMATRDGGP